MIKRSLMLLLLTGWLVLPTAAWAQANIDYLFALSLEELLRVKVTGSTLTEKELKTVPAAVTVFTHKQIMNLGLDNLDELMNLVPGFQSYRTSASPLSYQYSSRGRRIGNASAEILVLVDGLRLADPRTSGGAVLVPKYPLMQVQRVEFIRGPGSAVYGSNAMMGVVNIITRSQVNEASLSVGSFDRRKGHVMASQQSGDLSFDVFASLDVDKGDDYNVQDTFSAARINTQDPRELASLNIKLNWHNTQFRLHHNQFKSEDFYEIDGVSNDHNEHTGELTALSVQQDFHWQGIASNIWLGHTRSNYTSAVQLSAPGMFAAISTPTSNDALLVIANYKGSHETRMQWHNDWSIDSTSSAQFGIEARQIKLPAGILENNFDLTDFANFTGAGDTVRYYGTLLATTQVQAKSQRDIVGAYGQYQKALYKGTHLTLGLRHDSFSNIDGKFSPRFALVHELNAWHSFKLLYGEAFRAPAEDELNVQNNPVITGNPNLKAEIIQSGELIWLGQWAQSGVSLGYFESHYKDAIVQISSGNSAIYDNVDQDSSKGVEFEFTHQLSPAWLWRTTYTHLLESPDLSFRESEKVASVMVNFQRANWNANLFVNYQSIKKAPAFDINGERIALESYWQVAGKLRYYLGSNVQFFVQAKNLLDEAYLTPAASNKLTASAPNRGREILMGFDFEF